MPADPNDPGSSKRGDDGPTFDDPPTTEVGFALAEKVVGGRFKLGERLSWGGMGTIYRALDLHTQREVAVKIPHLGDPINDVRFQAESEAVRSVVCTSVIGYVAHGHDAEEPFLAMELVAGQPLWRHLQRGALDLESAFAVARRISSALAAIHLGGWIHRDIKPGNVVVAPDGSVKLLDFGLSRPIAGDGTGTLSGQLVGTLGYMSPEQFAPGHVIDPRVDVYALGVVLFECLSGRRAFKRTLADVVAKAPEGALDIRPLKLGAAYTEVLERCVARSPEERPADGLDLLVRLLAARDGRFTHVPLDVARRVLHGLLRKGVARVEGDVPITTMLAELLAEMVAPSVVLRVGCDPPSTQRPLSHASAIAAALAEAGQPALAGRLRPSTPESGRSARLAEPKAERTRAVILVVEDAVWCDSATVERLMKLAQERALFVIFATSFEQVSPATLDEAPRARVAPPASPWPTGALDPMERWALRAASMFGRRFPSAGVSTLVAGDEARDLASALARVAHAGWIDALPSAPVDRGGPWFRFATGGALFGARSLAAPPEQRLGARLASAWMGRASLAPEIELVASVDVACPALAPRAS
ncbi:MAG: serine/threonine-protein kinase [Polyangiaceae bacterium]